MCSEGEEVEVEAEVAGFIIHKERGLNRGSGTGTATELREVNGGKRKCKKNNHESN